MEYEELKNLKVNSGATKKIVEKFSQYQNVLALTNSQKRNVYSIRYQSYLSNGSINPNRDRLFTDEYDTKPNCNSFLLTYQSLPIASIRSCIYSRKLDWFDIPALASFNKEIISLGLNKTLVEVNKLVFHPDFQNKLIHSKLYLFKNIAMTAQIINADYIITAVRKSQLRLYRAMSFEKISDEKDYPGLNFKVVLLCADFKKMKEMVFDDIDEKIKLNHTLHTLVRI